MFFKSFQNFSGAKRLFLGTFLAIIISVACFYIFKIIGAFIFGINYSEYSQTVAHAITSKSNKDIIYYTLVTQSINFFLIPSLIIIKARTNDICQYWGMNKKLNLFFLFIIIQLIISNIPGMNMWAYLNNLLTELIIPPYSPLHKLYIENTLLTDFLLKTDSYSLLFINLICMAIIPAVAEEFFFRGTIQRLLFGFSKNYRASIFITATLFSLLHGDLYNFFPRLFMGIIFGYLCWYTNSIWVPILAHFIHNATVVTTFFLIEKNMITPHIITIGEPQNGLFFGITSIVWVGISLFLIIKLKSSFDLSEHNEQPKEQ